jgi:dienelactone hydrolase
MHKTRLKMACFGLAIGMCAIGAVGAQQVVNFRSLDGIELKALVFHPTNTSTTQTKRGTVIALHGCDGLYAEFDARNGKLNARHHAMAELLLADGYTAVFPDSLTPRGAVEVCTQKASERTIDQNQRRADVLATLAWVALQPWAMPERIALLGWSHGGSALLAATDASRADVRSQNVKPALAVAFYPGCAASLKSGYQVSAPLVLMLGEKDEWTPPEPCIALGKAAAAEVNVYADSHHGFDEPIGEVKLYSQVPNSNNPGQGVRAGHNSAAREKSYARLRVLLAKAVGQ